MEPFRYNTGVWHTHTDTHRHSRRYDFQGHPRSESRSGDDLSSLRDYFSKVAIFPIRRVFEAQVGGDLWISWRTLASKTREFWAICCLRDDIFCRLDKTPTCVGRTDGLTQGHGTYRASITLRGKILWLLWLYVEEHFVSERLASFRLNDKLASAINNLRQTWRLDRFVSGTERVCQAPVSFFETPEYLSAVKMSNTSR